MQSYDRYTGLTEADKGAVIALGNFDGLHRGHQAVIERAKAIADDLDAPLGIGLFRPHPFRFFKPEAEPFRLMRKHVVVGQDYGFGKNRCGNVESLTKLCAERGIGVTALEPIGLHKLYGKYGSTEIRKALKDGDVFHAAHMLSRPWCVDGRVQKGAQRGRTINFPTANIEFGDLVRPKFGVYAVEVTLPDGGHKYGVANTGNRPTVGGEAARLEVNIFDYAGDLYGQRLKVHFRAFIRPEQKFESFDALKNQIQKDADGARALFGILD